MIQFTKGFVCSDGNEFSTLVLAQEHELAIILKEVEMNPSFRLKIAAHIVRNSEKIVHILLLKQTD